MPLITRALPHLITAIGLAATGALLAYYADNQAVQLEMAETMFFASGWEAKVVDAAYQAITTEGALPCPARTERTMQGRGGAYLLAAEVTRAEFAPLLDRPVPACDSTSGTYLIQVTAGTTEHPTILQGELAIDMAEAQAHPEKLLRPAVRVDQRLVFTAATERP